MGWFGYRQTSSRLATVAIIGGISFASICVKCSHTGCVTGSGVAYCWGLNIYGELGDGTTTDRLTPVAVSGGLSLPSIIAGAANTWMRAEHGIVDGCGSAGLTYVRLNNRPSKRAPSAGLSGHSSIACAIDTSYSRYTSEAH